MNNVYIHGCVNRQKYIDTFLVPSLQQQNIEPEIYIDTQQEGNLKAFISSLKHLLSLDPELKLSYWHLQDDIIISKNFNAIVEKYQEDTSSIICGFAGGFDTSKNKTGIVDIQDAWFSFPCIKIPNLLVKKFLEWYEEVFIVSPKQQHQNWIDRNKYDDNIFHLFLNQECQQTQAINLRPNIVNHIDYLIGGSIANSKRSYRSKIVSLYWEEPEAIAKLAERLRACPC